ncbi:Cro/CI family transcriptional regulator [Paraburkholderia sp. BL6665CI2N2]|uniref:Cro/CI family transcriptional regulator n=1 Tax=Paraburkholderia sp. BL6665CI2N2 TaxID=1938806 RepID=UPI001AB03B71|nr:Cro/CI family transcriptional regulator [Paraburkholderia sp. BL6665CI2N2]
MAIISSLLKATTGSILLAMERTATSLDTAALPVGAGEVARAIDHLGGDSAVARLLNLTAWAVSKWRRRLPERRVLWLAERTAWKFTPHQLCPELYPHPDDGLPIELRGVVRTDCKSVAAAAA